MTFGYSRDDAGVVPAGLHREGDPARGSVREPRPGRRRRARRARRRERGRAANPKLKVGICGEHGGDPRSIEFFHARGPRLRLLLALPRARSRAWRPRGRRCRKRRRLVDGMIAVGGSLSDRDDFRCGAGAGRPRPPRPAKIWTGDPARPEAEALRRARRPDRRRRDDDAEIQALQRPEDVVSWTRRGRRVVPGFIDCAHPHDDGRAQPAGRRPAPHEGPRRTSRARSRRSRRRGRRRHG